MRTQAIIPVGLMGAANEHLGELGFGYGNFSVPLRESEAELATHAGFSAARDPAFRQAVLDMMDSGDFPGLEVEEYDGNAGQAQGKFEQMVGPMGMQWPPKQDWLENLPNKGDQIERGGKTWESLIDNNAWPVPVGWREVVEEGYPEWVQPTGGHDAYQEGDRVRFDGGDYESLIDDNVWSPTDYPQGWVKL